MSGFSNSNDASGLEIAVIGMAGRFPEAKDIQEFWSNLVKGKECVSFFSEDELLGEGIPLEVIRKNNYIKAKPYIDDIESFDAYFFGYSPREAVIMDPHIRVFHETVHHALEDSGYDPQKYDGLISLYAGASTSKQWMRNVFSREIDGIADRFETGFLAYKDMLSQLVSYKLNLRGPSHTLYTACSTSLTAIHLACQGLLMGECSIAVAGGVTIELPIKSGYFYQEGMILSSDGHCRPFDAKASGTLFGDGSGAVVLKRLEDAIEDRDNIYAVIKASACNNDGQQKVGFAAPSVQGQQQVLEAAYDLAGVAPQTISFVEAHGTGTDIGDPIEVEALTNVFSAERIKYCTLGSVKSNIGHLHAAAGVASFIKTVLALYKKQIPPTINCSELNPKVDWANSPFQINTELQEWETMDGKKRRAGVSSFGIGGTNTHVILEESPLTNTGCYSSGEDYVILFFSAKSKKSLELLIDSFLLFFDRNPDVNITDVAYTLQVGRQLFGFRKACVVQSTQQAVTGLSKANSSFFVSSTDSYVNRPVSFIFSAKDSEDYTNGFELYQKQPVFKKWIDHSCEQVKAIIDLRQHFFEKPKDVSEDNKIKNAILFIYEYSMAQLWISWGISPQVMIGENVGELVAATLAGVFDLKDALAMFLGDDNSCDEVILKTPRTALFSIGIGDWISNKEAQDPSHWKAILSKKTTLQNYPKELFEARKDVFLGIGPCSFLTDFLKDFPKENETSIVLSSFAKPSINEDESSVLYRCLSQLAVSGVAVDWDKIYVNSKPRRLSLPLYPFDRKNYWSFQGDQDCCQDLAHPQKSVTLEAIQFEVRPQIEASYQSPSTEAEQVICELVRDLLGVDPIGVNDDFFELGGHSLLATQLISRIKDIFQVELSLETFFKKPTVNGVLEKLMEIWMTAEKIEKIALLYREYQNRKN